MDRANHLGLAIGTLRRSLVLSVLAGLCISACQDLSRENTHAQHVQTDRRLVTAHPERMRDIATRIGRPDAQGRIGRNRAWGDLYSVRFQYGAGRAFRYGVAARDDTVMSEAWKAIQAGLRTMDADGRFPARLPKEIAGDRQPGPSDAASAAAFFLSDICPAMLADKTKTEHIAHIETAMRALTEDGALLQHKDRAAPNRLLIDALAFQSCGHLVGDPALRARARPFVDAALDFFESGVFVEAGGSDTSYQAVALVAAQDLIDMGYGSPDLVRAWSEGSAWLASRIDPGGRLNSNANTRSCGTETFIGRPKEVDLSEVFCALALYLTEADARLVRFEAWLDRRPDPCADL